MNTQAPSRIPTVPALLGYAGVLPFAALALLALFGQGQWPEMALRAFLAYGAVILSFLGGIRWGAAARATPIRAAEFVVAVVPSLWAWACLLAASPDLAAWGLLSGFLVFGLADWLRPPPAMAPWLVALRLRLTTAVALCHALVIIAT